MPVGGHGEISFARCPDLVLLHEHRADQPDDRVVEEMDEPLAAANLHIEPFDAIGGAQPVAVGRGQRKHRGGIVKAALQRDHCRGSRDLVVMDKARQQCARTPTASSSATASARVTHWTLGRCSNSLRLRLSRRCRRYAMPPAYST